MIVDNFWSKRACGTKSKALLISKKTEHISVSLLRDCKQSSEKDSKAVRQQWLTYHGEAPLPVRNWIVHIQVVRNNAVNVPFQLT